MIKYKIHFKDTLELDTFLQKLQMDNAELLEALHKIESMNIVGTKVSDLSTLIQTIKATARLATDKAEGDNEN